jgi:hypothetical protein
MLNQLRTPNPIQAALALALLFLPALLCGQKAISLEVNTLFNLPNLDTISPRSDARSFGISLFYESDWAKKNASFAIGSGAMLRNYGYSGDNSSIYYLTLPAKLRLSVINPFMPKGFLQVSGGVEYGRSISSLYRFPAPNNPSNTNYNQFLHQNDLITYSAGIGLGFNLKKEKVKVVVSLNINRQWDSFDLHYGKTVRANSVGVDLRYRIFKLK